MRRSAWQIAAALAAILLLELLFWRLHRLRDLETFIIPATGIFFAAGIVYIVALYLLEHTPEKRVVFWLVLAGGLLFRLTLLPLRATLSDDLYRYRWDGRIQQAGWNPYTVRPDDPRLASLREPGDPRLPGHDIPSIYPPLAELFFRADSHLFQSPVAFKLPILGADLFAMFLLAYALRGNGKKNWRLAIYAWNPLVIVEFAGSGHSDALAIAAVVAAFVIIRSRPALSTTLLAAGALLKSFPLLFFPSWVVQTGWPRRRAAWWGLVGAGLVALVCFLPYISALSFMRANMAYYETRWENNNASLYVFILYLARNPVLAGRISAGIAALAALAAAWRRLSPERAAFLITGAILLFSPNAYSWYFTWMLPWLCFFPNPAWLLLSVLQFLSYHVLIGYQILGTWKFDSRFVLLTYVPFYALLLGDAAWRRFRPIARAASPLDCIPQHRG